MQKDKQIQLNFSIIIPVYNEEKNIPILFNEIKNNLNRNPYEIIFIDDCSSDKSVKKINDIIKNNLNVKLIKNKYNKGQSYCIYYGLKIAETSNIVTLDADLQNDPKDIDLLLSNYTNDRNLKLVSGIRKNRKDNFIKIFSSRIANKIRSLYLRDTCPDTGCSLKVFDKNVIMNFEFFDGIHRFIPSLYEASGYKVLYINVNHRYRKYGKSNYGISNRLFKGIRDLFKVKKIIKNNKNNNND